MADWIHCNKCCKRYQPNNKFYLKECGHLLCENCNNKIPVENQCIICNKVCNSIVLSNDLDPTIQAFFSPLEDTINRCVEISKFQAFNQKNLIKSLISKYTYAKNELIKAFQTINELKREAQRLRSLLRSTPPSFSSNNRGGMFPSSTPMSDISLAQGSNLSTSMINKFTPNLHNYNMKSGFWPGQAQRMNVQQKANLFTPKLHDSKKQQVSLQNNMFKQVPVHGQNVRPAHLSSLNTLIRGNKRPI